MATKYIKLRGKVAWCKPYETEEYLGKKFWSTNFYPRDAAEWDKFDAAKSQLKKRDDDGEKSGIVGKYIKVRRNQDRNFGDGPAQATPPNIFKQGDQPYAKYVDSDGKLVGSFTEAERANVKAVGTGRVLIGNGTDVILTIGVYPTKMGNGTDWMSIEVIDLVEYEGGGRTSEGSDENLEELPW